VQFVGEAVEERRQHLLTAQQQGVVVMPMRDRAVERRAILDRVALQHRHRLEVIGEDPGCHQSGHASADDDSLLPEALVHVGIIALGVGGE